jgi:hypothetical protein
MLTTTHKGPCVWAQLLASSAGCLTGCRPPVMFASTWHPEAFLGAERDRQICPPLPGSRAKYWLIYLPRTFLSNAVLLVLLPLAIEFSLRSLLVIQPDGFDAGGLSQTIQAFGNSNQAKFRLIGGAKESEGVLGRFPAGKDDLVVVISWR